MALRGDFDRLSALVDRARHIAAPSFRAGVLVNIAEAARTEIVLGFAKGTDPYGNKWAPLKAKRGSRRYGGQPLRDRGILQNSFNVIVTATGIKILSAAFYAGFHQYGTRRMVARMMVPQKGDLGPTWREAFSRVIEKQLEVASRGR